MYITACLRFTVINAVEVLQHTVHVYRINSVYHYAVAFWLNTLVSVDNQDKIDRSLIGGYYGPMSANTSRPTWI